MTRTTLLAAALLTACSTGPAAPPTDAAVPTDAWERPVPSCVPIVGYTDRYEPACPRAHVARCGAASVRYYWLERECYDNGWPYDCSACVLTDPVSEVTCGTDGEFRPCEMGEPVCVAWQIVDADGREHWCPRL